MNKQEKSDSFCFIVHVRWRGKLQVQATAAVDLYLESGIQLYSILLMSYLLQN